MSDLNEKLLVRLVLNRGSFFLFFGRSRLKNMGLI